MWGLRGATSCLESASQSTGQMTTPSTRYDQATYPRHPFLQRSGCALSWPAPTQVSIQRLAADRSFLWSCFVCDLHAELAQVLHMLGRSSLML